MPTRPPRSEEILTREERREERRALLDADQDMSKAFDQAVLALAAAGLGFSLTLAKELAPARQAARWLLVSAWIGFLLALLLILVSFLTSQAALRRQVKIVEENGLPPKQPPCHCDRVAKLAICGSSRRRSNLPRALRQQIGSAMTEKKERLEKGYVPPPPPANREKHGYVPPPPPKRETPKPPPPPAKKR